MTTSTPPRHGMSEQAADAAVDQAYRILRLPIVRSEFNEIAESASREQMTYRAFLSELLIAECDDRPRRPSERRIRAARFLRDKSQRIFDFGHPPQYRPRRHQPRHCRRLDQERPAALPDRELRYRQIPPAHRAGRRSRHSGLADQIHLATKLVNELAANATTLSQKYHRPAIALLCGR